jgi:hypothetical protein
MGLIKPNLKFTIHNLQFTMAFHPFSHSPLLSFFHSPFSMHLWLPKIVDPKMKHFNLWHEEKILNLH